MRIKSILIRMTLILLCYLFFPFRGRAKGEIDTSVVQKILVLSLSQLGDMVSVTPLFHHVKNKYPSARLYVSGKAINKQVLEYNKDVDQYVIFYEDKPWEFFKFLKKEKIDVALLIQTNFTSLALLYISGIKNIVAPTIVNGYSPFETKSYRLIRWLVTILPKSVGKNALDEHLKLLRPLGITDTGTERHLGFSNKAKESAQSFFKKQNISTTEDFIVMINPSSGNKIKNWPGDRFAKVADYIYEKYKAKIVVIGGPNDDEEVSVMLGALHPKTKVINTLNLFTIDELKAVTASADMFISVDAGPLYIAIAFDVPFIDILGPAPEYVPPAGVFNRMVFDRNRKEPAIHPLNNRDNDYKEARRQAEAITAEMVTNEVDDLYTSIKNKK